VLCVPFYLVQKTVDEKKLVQEGMSHVQVSRASRRVPVSCTSFLSVCQGH